ncbi:hypothetical protein GWK47_014465 [Chionoecetes opilio]|uniref:Uncharacterized protein n=1 Tax=Chionoecetes opilio TaxID=41210 RepID=A0A8J4XVX2_CHIOP|nr:hypothetical protein GWK47_014465 [Chionoecetes opilio]
MPVEEEEEQDPEVVVGQPANLHAQLEEGAPAVVKLPKHYRCGPDQAADIKDRIVREVKDIVGTKEEEQPEERKERMDKFHPPALQYPSP